MPSDGKPATCEIRDWIVFGEGYHKGTLYTREINQRMAENFARLSRGPNPAVKCAVKIGHDFQERSAQSLGFPSFGRIARCETEPNGLVHLWLTDVPTQVGAAVNAGLFTAGSIEIAPPMPDPVDQSQKLYPVLTGIALLGEEQPEVKLPYPIPRAVFADGTEVPPETDVTKWLQVMASVSSTFSRRPPRATIFGREVEATVLSFSALTPMVSTQDTPLVQARLAGMTDRAMAAAGIDRFATAAKTPDVSAQLAQAIRHTSGEQPMNEKIKALVQALVGCGIDQSKAESLAQILCGQSMTSDPAKPAAPVGPPSAEPAAAAFSAGVQDRHPGRTESGRRVLEAMRDVAPNSHKRLTGAAR